MGKTLGVFSILISGVGILSPLYGSQVFSAISGEKYKGYVSCVHFIILVFFMYFIVPRDSTADSSKKSKDEMEIEKEGTNTKVLNDGFDIKESSANQDSLKKKNK
jgi:uncharacterized membrane protein